MNRCKYVKKYGTVKFVLKSKKGQQLDERERYAINSNEMIGLLHMDVVNRKNSFQLQYNVTGLISLQEFLQKPLNQFRFLHLINSILENLTSLKNGFLKEECLLLDFRHVMVNPSTQRVYFIYVPIQAYESGRNLREFFLSIIQHAMFVPNENLDYAKEYTKILNEGINLSLFELEEFVKRLLNPGEITPPKKEQPKEPKQQKLQKIQHSVSEQISVIPDGTVVLGYSEEGKGGTTVLGMQDMYRYPYLIRKKNQEKIVINKPVFRLGKEKRYSDYFIADNNAVSRSHADIVTRNKEYFIIDKNSTNRTYVNGSAISPEKEIPLLSDTEIRLGNEEFIFYID